MPRNEDTRPLTCSFCGKTQEQVSRMVAGPGVCICNECVELCKSIIDDGEIPSHRRQQVKENKDIVCSVKMPHAFVAEEIRQRHGEENIDKFHDKGRRCQYQRAFEKALLTAAQDR